MKWKVLACTNFNLYVDVHVMSRFIRLSLLNSVMFKRSFEHTTQLNI